MTVMIFSQVGRYASFQTQNKSAAKIHTVLLSYPFQLDNCPTDFRISQLRFAKSPLRFGMGQISVGAQGRDPPRKKELQEEEYEMEHCRCNPRDQESTGHE